MYEDLGSVRLKSGETVESCLLTAPEPGWTSKIGHLLGHKGTPWRWQVEAVLAEGLDVESRFYLLHRDGQPFANIMTTELAGVGILGHVYTVPEDRLKGAAKILFEKLMPNFRGRGGRALFLGTDFNTPPFHLYARFGFQPCEPHSGEMYYHTTSADEFNEQYFASAATEIQPMGWPHWPASAPLFTGPWPGVVRCAACQLLGLKSSEVPFSPLVIDNTARCKADEPPCAAVLVNPDTDAVLGFACFANHPLWPSWILIDVYCHPAHWPSAGDLLEALQPPSADRQIAYTDPTCPARQDALQATGFKPTITLTDRVRKDAAGKASLDVIVYEREA